LLILKLQLFSSPPLYKPCNKIFKQIIFYISYFFQRFLAKEIAKYFIYKMRIQLCKSACRGKSLVCDTKGANLIYLQIESRVNEKNNNKFVVWSSWGRSSVVSLGKLEIKIIWVTYEWKSIFSPESFFFSWNISMKWHNMQTIPYNTNLFHMSSKI